jgi:hypothetical protein
MGWMGPADLPLLHGPDGEGGGSVAGHDAARLSKELLHRLGCAIRADDEDAHKLRGDGRGGLPEFEELLKPCLQLRHALEERCHHRLVAAVFTLDPVNGGGPFGYSATRPDIVPDEVANLAIPLPRADPLA